MASVRRPSPPGTSAAFIAALAPWIWLRHVAVGWGNFSGRNPDVIAFTIGWIGAVGVMLTWTRLARRLPPDADRASASPPTGLTRELAAAIAVGCAVLSLTANLLGAIAFDNVRAGRAGPAYPYILAAGACVAAAVIVGVRYLRRIRRVRPGEPAGG